MPVFSEGREDLQCQKSDCGSSRDHYEGASVVMWLTANKTTSGGSDVCFAERPAF